MDINTLNLLGEYIFRRIQKDNEKYKRIRPRESLTGLCIDSRDIQKYIQDYQNYGIDHMGDDVCADDLDLQDYFPTTTIPKPIHNKIERYWDDPDGKEK